MTEHEVGATPDGYAALVAQLDAELGWGLGEVAQYAYCSAIAQCMGQTSSEQALRRTIINYHLDHQLVEALANQSHHDHEQAWEVWMAGAAAIVRRQSFQWANDGALDFEDLAQVARVGLLQALPEFRYASRFSTWAYSVVARSARNELRARQAKKRLAAIESFDQLAEQPALAVDQAPHPEATAQSRLLGELIERVLGEQRDRRMLPIFRLWAERDQRVADIGEAVGLSEARVRVLIGQIVALLQHDPRVRAWAMLDDQ